MPFAAQKKKFMLDAIRLAKKGLGKVSPNPLVGAVLVKGDRIIGKGYHRFFGGPHAEVNALKSAGKTAREADMYINLEPCCHYGKTPPCTDALIEAKIGRVFIGMADPNPAVSGRGIKRLKKAGIGVETGILEDKCRRLNEIFIKFITTQTPFVILKAALTLDGKMATFTGDSKWITCEKSRRLVHRIRSEVDAVMVGIGTVIADDPLLTVRLYKTVKKNPLRIVVDSSLGISKNSRLLQPGLAENTIIATSLQKTDSRKAHSIENTGAQVLGVPLKNNRVDIKELLKLLGQKAVASLLIEGGSELNASALSSGIVDKVMLFYAPKIIGGRDAISMVGGEGVEKIAEAIKVEDISIRGINSDFLVEGYIAQKTN
jgi:diaminohydroxyphosphoribosylaminopyrimidine deaminase/5-amino-6-(5-phosphoribosylamino)uracil reductase